jgi:hypothetical protein
MNAMPPCALFNTSRYFTKKPSAFIVFTSLATKWALLPLGWTDLQKSQEFGPSCYNLLSLPQKLTSRRDERGAAAPKSGGCRRLGHARANDGHGTMRTYACNPNSFSLPPSLSPSCARWWARTPSHKRCSFSAIFPIGQNILNAGPALILWKLPTANLCPLKSDCPHE